jgi:hypothetical protein
MKPKLSIVEIAKKHVLDMESALASGLWVVDTMRRQQKARKEKALTKIPSRSMTKYAITALSEEGGSRQQVRGCLAQRIRRPHVAHGLLAHACTTRCQLRDRAHYT